MKSNNTAMSIISIIVVFLGVLFLLTLLSDTSIKTNYAVAITKMATLIVLVSIYYILKLLTPDKKKIEHKKHKKSHKG